MHCGRERKIISYFMLLFLSRGTKKTIECSLFCAHEMGPSLKDTRARKLHVDLSAQLVIMKLFIYVTFLSQNFS